MKTINETFTDDEYQSLIKIKQTKSWHDFIMLLLNWQNDPEEDKEINDNETETSQI